MELGRPRARAAIAARGDALSALEARAGSGDRERCFAPARLLEDCDRYGIAVTGSEEGRFPELLRHIPDPPLALFSIGALPRSDAAAVAVVGARRCSRLGREVACQLGWEIAAAGVCVVSGLALGIDAAAHEGALDGPGGGRAIAVLGCGLAQIYPRRNEPLARRVLASGGALISEYPPEVPPAKSRFPERNRLISGLSQAVIVVEAGERSGSLITARMALEQGREVMAVPGPVSGGASRGCHRLLREGAGLVECAGDVLEALNLPLHATARSGGSDLAAGLGETLNRVLTAVEPVTTTMDELVVLTGMAPEALSVCLIDLELAGFVERVPEGYIRRPFSPGT
ncbi:MAG: DNA-protecting protein DprA [Pseudomonadales bacterium]|nr:DNA-protecting protein DprA [Pseudomonadales bacterium]NIX08697.1 DNA-protecting protein DprA [Pseudomonadales bacterium]